MPTKISQLAEYLVISSSAFIPVVDANESAGDKNKKISIEDLRKVFYLNSNNSASFTRHTPGFYYFGDNSDGPGNFSGSITTLRTRISASFASTSDGPPVIKNFSSLFISRSVVISPTNRCRGMLIFVDGDAIISGSLRMTARGASAAGADSSFTTVNPPYLGDYWSAQLFPSSSYLSRVFAAGAAGGPTSPAAGAGPVGSAGTNGRSGGGGAGGGSGPASGGAGSAGTSYSGGSGGGGGGGGGAGSAASPNGGAGGNGNTFGAGGAGNPGGTSPSGNAGGNGTGGLLILIVRGNLKIGPNGSISSNGIAGGNFSSSPSQSGGGGGSGGGIIYIYYGGILTNNGTVTASGGSGGTAGPTNSYAGGSGGAGTSVLLKLNTAFPVAN
jgi:hypothetical protein